MYFSQFISTLPLLAGLASAVPLSERATTEDVTLYAYGTNISGLAVYYGNTDGLAYIVSDASNSSTYAALTWDISTSSGAALNATSNSTSTSVGAFYIVDSDSSFAAAGFISSNSTAPTGAATTGFKLFGGQLVYVDSTGNMEAQFWATTTSDSDVWSLMWNSDGTSQDSSVPVAIKTTAPAIASTK